MTRKFAQSQDTIVGLVAALALLWSACAPVAPAAPTAPAGQPAATSAPAAAGAPSTAKRTLRYAHNQATSTSQHKAVELFKKVVEERSKGALEIQIFPAAQLGGNQEQAEGVGLGTIDFTQQPSSVGTVFAPQMVALDLPFLFASEESAVGVLNGPVGAELMRTLEGKGIRGLTFWPTGAIHISTATKAVKTPDDLKGLKMRVLPSPLLTATYKAWGASPTSIDYKELYTALQQKVVDGQENPIVGVVQAKLYEVQKYLSLTSHRPFFYLTMVSKKTFDSLSPDLQQVVLQADKDAQAEYIKLIHAEEADALKTLEDKGMTIVRLSNEEREAFRKSSLPVYEQFADQIGRDLLQRLQGAVKTS